MSSQTALSPNETTPSTNYVKTDRCLVTKTCLRVIRSENKLHDEKSVDVKWITCSQHRQRVTRPCCLPIRWKCNWRIQMMSGAARTQSIKKCLFTAFFGTSKAIHSYIGGADRKVECGRMGRCGTNTQTPSARPSNGPTERIQCVGGVRSFTTQPHHKKWKADVISFLSHQRLSVSSMSARVWVCACASVASVYCIVFAIEMYVNEWNEWMCLLFTESLCQCVGVRLNTLRQIRCVSHSSSVQIWKRIVISSLLIELPCSHRIKREMCVGHKFMFTHICLQI